jgi:hypothetical protein
MISNKEFKAISELDLDPIKVKLMHKESGEGWTLEYANAVESEYRRFLYLMKMFPNEQTAPLFDVDVFWHYHILDTMKYAVDCETVFGYFLHHFPYIGLRGEDDEAAHHRLGTRMQQLYEDTFGEPCRLTSQDGPESAWSAAIAQDASAGAQATTAWSAAASGAADGHARKTAWSARVSGTPANASGKTAWSAVVAKTAWSAVVAKTAWSAASAKTAWSAAAVQDGSGAQAVTVDRFYSDRPVLAA